MKRSLMIFGVLLAMTTTLAAQDKKELEKLAGKWQPTMMQMGETKTPSEQLKQITLTIDGEKYHTVVNGQSDKGRLKIDTKAKPKTMDIVGTEGPNKGKTFLCIYEIDGDTFKICYALDGKKRPTEFKSTGDKVLFVTYKKMKEEAKN